MQDDLVYKQRVLDFITGTPVPFPLAPIGRPAWPLDSYLYVPPIGDSIDPNLFNKGKEDETQVFIMTPIKFDTDQADQDLLYDTHVKEIQKAINDHLDFEPKVTVYGYKRLNYNDPADHRLIHRTRRGFALFQYDPNSDKKGGKAWRVFLEGNFYRKSTTPGKS